MLSFQLESDKPHMFLDTLKAICNMPLKLLLIETYYMRNGINKGSGAYIVIENGTKIPSIVSSAISVMPGAETNIGLQTRRLLRLPKPFKSNCTSHYGDESVLGMIGSEFAYSSKTCKGLCYALKFYNGCKCVYPSMIEGFKIEQFFETLSKQGRMCNIRGGSDDQQCIWNLAFAELNKTCSCSPECVESKYRVC